jgi:3'-5' exoribonuclease
VFCNRLGKPLDHKNVTNRVWYPLLRHLGLKKRRPYQCRHTAATLWLAAGEAPEWIARQLGHTTTEMLFRVYSRYVPNLTRRDGSAFERLITQSIADTPLPVNPSRRAAMSDGQTVFSVSQLPQPDHVIDRLPPVFRIQSIERLPFDERNLLNVAVVFHERAVLRVEWLCRHPDSRLTAGSLVSIRWLGRPTSTLGAIRIARLVKLERPEASLNPFDTVPHAWVRDRELVARAGRFWEGLGRPLQHLFNAVFWDHHRFQRYLEGPSSLQGHHNGRNGNFRHALEVAERARTLGSHHAEVHLPVLIAASLLHDAGKAEEYQVQSGAVPLRDDGTRGAAGPQAYRSRVDRRRPGPAPGDRAGGPLPGAPSCHHRRQGGARLAGAAGAPEPGCPHPVDGGPPLGPGRSRQPPRARDGGFGAYHRHLGGRPYVVRE